MPENTPKKKSVSEKGHAKFLESFDRLLAVDATLDPLKLNAPPDMTSAKLAGKRVTAGTLLDDIGAAKANWRTVTLVRQTDADELDSMAAQAVALLEAQGASAETIEDARSMVRKLRGDRKSNPTPDNPLTLDVDESDGNISTSQQSNAARIAMFGELIDFLEVQPEYASVNNTGFKIAELKSFKQGVETKHLASITAATALDGSRTARNDFYYIAEKSVLNIAKRYKKLVFGAYGGDSEEYKAVSEIPFQMP